MKDLTFGVLFIFGIIISGCSKSQYPTKQTNPKNLTPRELLQAVKQHYQEHNRLEVKAKGKIRINLKSKRMKRQNVVHSTMYFASSPPGKFRIRFKDNKSEDIVVSNGTIVWHYFSLGNKYSKKKYEVPQNGNASLSWKIKTFGSNFYLMQRVRRAFNPLADSIMGISAVSQDTIKMPDSTFRKTLKINVKYVRDSLDRVGALIINRRNSKVSIKDKTRFPFTFWIDPETKDVIRESFGKSIKVAVGKKKDNTLQMVAHNDIYFTSVNFHPNFTDSTFIFKPPKGVRTSNDSSFAQKTSPKQLNKLISWISDAGKSLASYYTSLKRATIFIKKDLKRILCHNSIPVVIIEKIVGHSVLEN